MDIFAVIADPTRRTMLEMLVSGERAAGEFVAAFPQVSQPAISQHLKVLRDSEMVTVRAERQKRFYALRSERLDILREWLSVFTGPVAAKAPRKAAAKPAAKAAAKPRPAPVVEPVMFDLFD